MSNFKNSTPDAMLKIYLNKEKSVIGQISYLMFILYDWTGELESWEKKEYSDVLKGCFSELVSIVPHIQFLRGI